MSNPINSDSSLVSVLNETTSDFIQNLNDYKNSIFELSFRDLRNLLFRYLREVLEVFVIYGLYTYLVSDRVFDLRQTIKMAFILGLVTFAASNYSKDYRQNIKTGFLTSVSSGFVKAGI